MRNLKIIFLGILLVFVCTVSSSWAGIIYAIDHTSKSLISIDPVTLAITDIGSTGVSTSLAGDLACDEVTQTMYWVAGQGNNNLYTVDLSTGAATLIGSHGISDVFALGYNGTDLYGQSGISNVYTLNKNTGSATLIGSNSVYPGGYDWNPVTNQMILLQGGGSGQIYDVNLSNGSATLLASPGWVDDTDITYDSDRNVYWAIDLGGRLYQYDSSWNRTTMLTTANLSAAIEYVGAPVPIPATMLLLGSGLIGIVGIRRKFKK